MVKITNQLYLVFSWFNDGRPTCERERTHRQIRTSFTEVRLHTPGL